MAKKKNELPRLSPKETIIMNIVWEKGTTTIREVWEEMLRKSNNMVSRTTVQVQMSRLELKGWLEKEQEGATYMYKSTRPPLEGQKKAVKDFTGRLFDSSISKLVKCFTAGEKISDDELSRLRDLVDNLESKSTKQKKRA